jgi:hypothetical protein
MISYTGASILAQKDAITDSLRAVNDLQHPQSE